MIFESYIRTHTGRQIDKWAHYGPIYDRHFAHRAAAVKSVLEIGIDHGGSLQLWKRAFPKALIVGVDINPECKKYEEPGIQIEIGNQADPGFWNSLWDHYTGFDIVIDDGSHVREHQSISFNALWRSTRMVYLIEDCHGPYPAIVTSDRPLRYEYPWVLVLERPERIIRGTPSRDLRPDELEAREKSLA